MRHCANCGTKLQPEDRFCPECGTKLKAEVKVKPDKEEKEKKGGFPWLKFVFVVASFLFLFNALFLFAGVHYASTPRVQYYKPPAERMIVETQQNPPPSETGCWLPDMFECRDAKLNREVAVLVLFNKMPYGILIDAISVEGCPAIHLGKMLGAGSGDAFPIECYLGQPGEFVKRKLEIRYSNKEMNYGGSVIGELHGTIPPSDAGNVQPVKVTTPITASETKIEKASSVPVISINTPKDGESVEFLFISGDVRDDVLIKEVEIKVNYGCGGNILITPDIVIYLKEDLTGCLKTGENIVTVRATDVLGKSSERKMLVYYKPDTS